MRGFSKLVARQVEMQKRINVQNDPIYEFKKIEKVTRISRFKKRPHVFVILDKDEKVIYVGRALLDLTSAFSKFATLRESATLELFPFTREDAAREFARRLIYHYQPFYNEQGERND